MTARLDLDKLTLPIKGKSKITKGDKGQALLLVLLSLAVVLTVTLSIAGRSVTDLTVTDIDEDSERAFRAAEAGLERALISGSVSETLVVAGGTDAAYTADLSDYGSGTNYLYPVELFSGETATFWFVSHATLPGLNQSWPLTCSGKPCYTKNDINICWASQGTPTNQDTTPAVEIGAYYDKPPFDAINSQNFSSVQVARVTSDPNSSRVTLNQFSGTDSGNCGLTPQLVFRKNISLSSIGVDCWGTAGCSLVVRVRMLYNTDKRQPVGIRGTESFPAQGQQIVSTGTAGNAERSLKILRPYPEFPFIFDSVILSPNSIIK